MTTLLDEAIDKIADPVNREHCLRICRDALIDHMLGISDRSSGASDSEVVAETRVCADLALKIRSKMSASVSTVQKPTEAPPTPPRVHYGTPPDKKPTPKSST